MKKLFLLSIIFLYGSGIVLNAQPVSGFYKNPILPGMHPDPSICRVGNDYYLINSSFRWFPGIPIYHSRDLVNWEQLGHVLTRKSQLNLDKGSGIFASTIRYNNGKFYVISTNRRNGDNFIVTAENPAGPWSDPVWIAMDGADPSLYFEDGKAYVTTCVKEGILQAAIDIKTGRLLSDKKIIWKGTGGRDPEGPHLYKFNNRYYLMIAEGGTGYGHKITIAVSDAMWGPFAACPDNPILTQDKHSSQSNPLQGAGHGDIVQAADGSWWMVFLAFRPYSGTHPLDRETCLTPFTWNNMGWPVIPNNGTAMIDNHVATLPLFPYKQQDTCDSFSAHKLSPVWNFLGNPVDGSWSLQAHDGYLRIYGQRGNLDSSQAPQMLVRRVTSFSCQASTELLFNPVNANEEAGLTVYQSAAGHYDCFVRKRNGMREAVLRIVLGHIHYEQKSVLLLPGPVQLQVTAAHGLYTFSISQKGRSTFMGDADIRFLSQEVAGGWLGAHLGVYAAGNEKESTTPADFNWFEYMALP